MTATELVLVLGIGLAAGICGGLLGIGGSVVMLPLLTLTLGPNQQLYQAACMPVIVVVALGAVRRHWQAGTIRADWMRWLLPTTTIASIAGVLLGNRIPGESLGRIFGAFLLYVAASELVGRLRGGGADAPQGRPIAPLAATGIGTTIGGIAGLLGVGGGVVAVPLLRTVGRLPLREAIATSTAVMIAASTVGAIAKNASIASLTANDGSPLTLAASLSLSAALAPAALLGGYIGSRLTYALPLGTLRVIFAILIALAGIRMLGF